MAVNMIKEPITNTKNSTVKHYALIYDKKFTSKPEGIDLGMIHNTFKRDPMVVSHSLSEIMQAFCTGKTLILSMVQRDLKNQNDLYKAAELNPKSSQWANLHELNFKSTTLLALDIDDDDSITDVHRVIEHFKGKVSGAYHSFSHGELNDEGGTKNRYRLLFQLDEALTDYEAAKEFAIVLRDELVELYDSKHLRKKIDVMNPKSLWHGSKLDPIFIDDTAFISTSEYMEKVSLTLATRREAQEQRRKKQKEAFRTNTDKPVLFNELIEMANSIGHIPSGEDRYHEWFRVCMSIRSHEYADQITELEGIELFNIVSGHESDESVYLSLNPSGEISIGSFIKLATDSGYKRKHKYSYALQDATETIEVERITVDKYIPSRVATELIQRNERLIVDSATGSGKTTAFINAFKQLAGKEYNYFIFTVPTIALSEQVAKEHNLTCIKGGIGELKGMIASKVGIGERIFISTFDKAAEVVNHLTNDVHYKDAEKPVFNIVVDEIHKYTEAYNYRFAAIDKLKSLSEITSSFIGLSGTTTDVLKDDFDKLIKINNGVKSSPNMDYRVFTYDTSKKKGYTPEHSDLMLIPVVRGLLEQTRVLLFINNKERIQRIAKVLRGEGITVQVVTSDDKKSATYTSIVENQTIQEDVQVVISTVILSDGINIRNKLNWSCVVVADDKSPLFNPSSIKQMSNRFRAEYRYFALYMRTPNPDYTELTRFNIESEFQYRLRTVKKHVDYLNDEFKDQLKDFVPSTVEKYNGIYYRSSDDAAKITYNPLFIRHQSMKTKEFYYKGHRNAFINEVGRMIGHKLAGVFNVNDEVKRNGSDLSGLLAAMIEEKEEVKLAAGELRANFPIYYTPEIHESFVYKNNQEALERFKEFVHADQYAATVRNSNLADYETCKKLGESIKKRADINMYFNDIQALAEIASIDYVKNVSVTKRIYNELAKMELKTYTSADFKNIVDEQLPKRLKVSRKEVKEALKLFHRFNSRNKRERLTTIRPLSVDLVAKSKHELEPLVIESSLLKYIASRPAQQREIMYAAILDKWGIEKVGKKTSFSLNLEG